MATTRIIWTGDSANAPAVANNLYGIDQDTADRLVAALKTADAKRLEIRDDGHLWQVGADGTSLDIGLVNDTGALENVVIGKGAEAGATAENVVAVGANAQADWRQSTAVGFRAAADGTCAVAVGAGASGSGSDAVAVGDVASASARDATAVGASAVAGAEHATAVGEGAEARHSFAVALGSGSVTDADNTVSVGSGVDNGTGSSPAVRRIVNVGDPVADTDAATKAYADSCRFTVKGEGEESIAISAKGDASSAGRNSIAIGKKASACYNYSVVIGPSAKDLNKGTGSSCTIIGSAAMGALSAVSIGRASGTNNGSPAECHGVSVGCESEGLSTHSTAVGHHAKALGANKDNTTGSDAFGEQTVARASGAVAIGFSSVADEEDTVSVGGDKSIIKARRIVHVADPVNAQDAATKAYVDTHAASGGYTLPAATATTLGGVKVGAGLSATSDGTLSTSVAQSLDLTNSALAIGDGGTTATGGATMAVGLGATASAGNAIAVGQAAVATGDSDLAVGNSATVSGAYGTAIGVRATAAGWSTAIGSEAASVSNVLAADAFGCKSSATAGHAVALGASSVADAEWSVSVGNSSNTRRIMHVTDPTDAQDAATKSYVDALKTQLTALEKRVAALEAAK